MAHDMEWDKIVCHSMLLPVEGNDVPVHHRERSPSPLIEQMNEDATAVEIVSGRGSAILISSEEYSALVETAHLLRSPANARRLLDSRDEARAGQAVERGLLQ